VSIDQSLFLIATLVTSDDLLAVWSRMAVAAS
jgi:hypothetical protein